MHVPSHLKGAPCAGPDADERELEDFLRTTDPVAFEAALWLTRQQGGLSAAEQQCFEQWLAADSANARAYADLEPGLEGLRALAAAARARLPAIASSTAAAPPMRADTPRAGGAAHQPALPGRRAWLFNVARLVPVAAAAGIAAAVVGGHWLDWDGPAGRLIHMRRYTTSRGELREVMLDDGSTLTLDAGTSIWVALYQGRREVTVQHGQVMFAVSPDAGRPFDVLAGALRVTVVGTRFAVRQTETGLDAGRTVVAVESGRVRVEPLQRGFAGEATFLGAGERVSADAQGRLDEVVQVGAQSVAVWRQGRVSFNDTPLSQALAEFERYGPTGLALGDPAVGQLRLGGTFDLHAAQRFAQALPHLLPVRVQKTAHGIVIGSKR
ncbi:hypothetical protein BTL47_13955 [Bordetella holmesii]|nr:hypothetical protein BTL46_13915 [Bordetella holmesii]AUL52648.1 hypothetical protein BTL47_13955 [Bordetella holmesii]